MILSQYVIIMYLQLAVSFAQMQLVPTLLKALDDNRWFLIIMIITILFYCNYNCSDLVSEKGAVKGLGRPQEYFLPEELTQFFQEMTSCSSIIAYQRLKAYTRVTTIRGVLYSTSYKRLKKKNSNTVEYACTSGITTSFGIVQQFICFDGRFYAMVIPLTQKTSISTIFGNSEAFIYHQEQRAVQIVEQNGLTIIDVHNIIGKSIYMEINNTIYIGRLPNTLKSD